MTNMYNRFYSPNIPLMTTNLSKQSPLSSSNCHERSDGIVQTKGDESVV